MKDRWLTIMAWLTGIGTIAAMLDEIMGGAELNMIGGIFVVAFFLLIACGAVGFMATNRS